MKGVARIFAVLLLFVATDVVTHAWVIERNGSSTAARRSLVCAGGPKCHSRHNSRLHAAAAYPNNDKKSSPLIRRLEIRAVDPSAVPSVGSTVVANSDFVDLNIWQFQSFQLSGIRDYNMQELLKEREQSGQGATTTLTDLLARVLDKRPAQRLDDPLAEGYIRYVTLTGRSIGSVTMRLSGSYSHGLSSLWILDTIV